MAGIDPDSLRLAMERANMTQTQLGNECGLSRSYVCEILGGKRKLSRSPKVRSDLAKALNVPIHWIEKQQEVPA